MAAALAFCGVMAGLIYLLLKWPWLQRIAENSGLTSGLKILQRKPQISAGQILAFAITLMAMLIVGGLRQDLLSNWQSQLPENVPNFFAFNIQSEDKLGLLKLLNPKVAEPLQLYPIVRGRLAQVNGEPLSERFQSGGDRFVLNNELSLTWAAELQDGNEIIDGQWWTEPQPADAISIDSGVAESFQIEVGDRLTFDISGRSKEVTVQSIRWVEWGRLSPNFYMTFAPGALDTFPISYLTSFQLAPADRSVLRQVARDFPATTLVDVDIIIDRAKSVLQQATIAIELVLVFILLAGVAVLLGTVQNSLDERLQESALRRALGASRRALNRAHFAEFAWLGLLAGVIAVLGSQLALYGLYTAVFELKYQWPWALSLVVPLGAALVIGMIGFLGTRKVSSHSPLELMKA